MVPFEPDVPFVPEVPFVPLEPDVPLIPDVPDVPLIPDVPLVPPPHPINKSSLVILDVTVPLELFTINHVPAESPENGGNALILISSPIAMVLN